MSSASRIPRPATRTEPPADALPVDMQTQRPHAESSAQVVARVELGERRKPMKFSLSDLATNNQILEFQTCHRQPQADDAAP